MKTDALTHGAALRTFTTLMHNGGYTIEAFDGPLSSPGGEAASRDAGSLGLTVAQARGLCSRGWLVKDHHGSGRRGASTYAVTARGALAAVRIALVELRLALNGGKGYVARRGGIGFADLTLRDLVCMAPNIRYSLVAAHGMGKAVSAELGFVVREIAALARTFTRPECRAKGLWTAADIADVGRILAHGGYQDRANLSPDMIEFDRIDVRVHLDQSEAPLRTVRAFIHALQGSDVTLDDPGDVSTVGGAIDSVIALTH